MNNFSDIVAFVRVVEAHSFVAAAQTLGMSPSAISKAVSRLEETGRNGDFVASRYSVVRQPA